MEPPNLYPVKLYVYDLSKGLARRLSPIMLGEGTGVSGKFCRDAKRGSRVRVGWGSLTPLFSFLIGSKETHMLWLGTSLSARD